MRKGGRNQNYDRDGSEGGLHRRVMMSQWIPIMMVAIAVPAKQQTMKVNDDSVIDIAYGTEIDGPW